MIKLVKIVLGFVGIVRDRIERCEYTYDKSSPYLVFYLTAHSGACPGTIRIFGSAPIVAQTVGDIRQKMSRTSLYAPKIKRWLDKEVGVDMQAFESLPPDTVDLPSRSPSNRERLTRDFPWWQ